MDVERPCSAPAFSESEGKRLTKHLEDGRVADAAHDWNTASVHFDRARILLEDVVQRCVNLATREELGLPLREEITDPTPSAPVTTLDR